MSVIDTTAKVRGSLEKAKCGGVLQISGGGVLRRAIGYVSLYRFQLKSFPDCSWDFSTLSDLDLEQATINILSLYCM